MKMKKVRDILACLLNDNKYYMIKMSGLGKNKMQTIFQVLDSKTDFGHL